MDFQELKQQFIHKLQKEGKSANTLKNYHTDLQIFSHFMQKEGRNFIEVTTPQWMSSYGDYLHNRYSASNSKRRRLQTLRHFFDFLVIQKIIDHNPVLGLPPSPKFLDIPRPCAFGDIQRVWTYLSNEKKSQDGLSSLIAMRNLLVVMFTYGAALQASQLAEIKVSQIYLGSIPRVMVAVRKRDPYSIPLPNSFTPLFKEYLKKRQKLYPNLFQGHSEEKILFNANHHTIISDGLSVRGLEIIMKELSQKLNLKMTLKNLRQASIFKWIFQGHSEENIKEWLGVADNYSLNGHYNLKNNYLYNDNFWQ